MTWSRQYSIRTLLLLSVLVAHACSKPGIARTLHTGPIESIDTWTPFVISIQYSDAKSLDDHTETYIGAFGQYWLYSHQVSIIFGCFDFRSEVPLNCLTEARMDLSVAADSDKDLEAPE